MIRRHFFIIFLMLLFVASCLKEPQKPSWDVSIIAPLFKTTLGISSFLPDSILDSDSTHQIHIVYNEVLYEYAPASLLETPDTITNQQYQPPFNATLQPGQLFLNKNEQKIYKFGDTKLSLITVKQGYVYMQVSNTVKEAILMTYSIPMAKKNGISFEFTELVPAASNQPYVYTKRVDISGYTIDLRGANGLGANIISTNFKARLNPNGTATAITPQDYFNAFIKFDEFTLSYAKGYFGNTSLNLVDTSRMDVFNIIKSGNFDLENIDIKLDIVNGFGLDAQMFINEMTSINTFTNQSVFLHAAFLGQPLNIIRATETGHYNAPVIPTVYPLNFNNANIKQMFENMPNRLSFDINGFVNPMGNISGGNDFYYDGYGLKIMLNLDIPLSLKAHALTLVDTVKFNIEKSTEKNTITKGTFNLIADNGFPFDATLQLYMLNDNNLIVDSLLFNNLVMAAPLDNNNIVLNVRRTVLNAPMPADKLNLLYDTKKMAIKVIFNTNNNPYLKLYDFYKIDLKLTGDFDFIVEQ